MVTQPRVKIGKYCCIGENTVLRPSWRLVQGWVSKHVLSTPSRTSSALAFDSLTPSCTRLLTRIPPLFLSDTLTRPLAYLHLHNSPSHLHHTLTSHTHALTTLSFFFVPGNVRQCAWFPLKIGNYVRIGDNCVVEAFKIGAYVKVGVSSDLTSIHHSITPSLHPPQSRRAPHSPGRSPARLNI